MDLSHVARREVFSAPWAGRHGLDSDAIRREVAAGRAYPLFRGCYAIREPVDDADWNRLAARAAYLRFDGRAMASTQSALLWHNLPVQYADLRPSDPDDPRVLPTAASGHAPPFHPGVAGRGPGPCGCRDRASRSDG